MTTATKGLTLSKEDALRSLTDIKGNHIEFEEQEDGSLISKAVESDNYTYTYSLVPQTTIVVVSVIKESKNQTKKEVVEAGPEKTTKKEYTSKKSY
jgi:hypothetical protein